MAIANFRAFVSTITRFVPVSWSAAIKLLVDPTTGAPCGIQNPNANGADGIWTPIDVSAAQIQSPTALMIADLNATYRLNVAPYTRFQSNGTALVSLGGGESTSPTGIFASLSKVVPGIDALTLVANSQLLLYAPFTVQNAGGVTVQGTLRIANAPF